MNTLKYFAAEHLPRPDFVLLDPQAMNSKSLREFFSHIVEREKTFENANIFHFQHVEVGRKERKSDDDHGTIEGSGVGLSHGSTAAEGGGHTEGAEDSGNAEGAEETGNAEGARVRGHAECADASTAQVNPGDTDNSNQGGDLSHRAGESPPLAPPPNVNPAKNKKKKTQGSTTHKKKPKKTPNQHTTLPSPEDASGAGCYDFK
jgi:hypothetical protein